MTCVEGEVLDAMNSEDVEWCNCGTLMAHEFGGEELLRGSCDVDDGHGKRDDATQGGGDGYEVTHKGDGGAKEKSLPQTFTYNKPDGNVNTPDARMAEPSS